MGNGTARGTRNTGWTPDGPISGKMGQHVARLRILADRLSGEARVEANSIASAIMKEAQRVDGLEGIPAP